MKKWLIALTVTVIAPNAFSAEPTSTSSPGAPLAPPAANAFDPKGYIQDRPVDTGGGRGMLKEAETKINGIPYIVYTVNGNSIVLPLATRFRPSDLDSARCTQAGVDQTADAVLARAQRNLSEKMTVYADLIQQTIVAKCGETSAMRVYVDPDPEIGIRYHDDKKRDGATYKVFKKMSEPGIGAGIEF